MANEKLISANDLITTIRDDAHIDGRTFARVKEHIEEAKDAVKYGRWIAYESDETYGPYDSKEWYKCSECGKDAYGRCYDDEWYSSPILSDYCHNCGAKMDGDGNG